MMNPAKKGMDGMGLGAFAKSGSKRTAQTTEVVTTQAPNTPSPLPLEDSKRMRKKPKKSEGLVMSDDLARVNLQITKAQQGWITAQAKGIREGAEEPLPGPERVYPVHLVRTAIAMLMKDKSINWAEISSVSDLEKLANR